jgi:hypothetical protein
MRPLLFISLVSIGCGNVRFAERAILWTERDDIPVPEPPERRNPTINWEGVRESVFRPAKRFFGMDYSVEAKNTNALDEVPDSTWFTNRRRDPNSPNDQPRWLELPPDAVERGAADGDAPEPPFVVLNEKTEGSSQGLVVTDARGVKYMLKLDPSEYPGLETSIEVVATRLAWAAGWNVPADTLIELPPSDLTLAPDAYTKDRYDRKHPLTADDLHILLTPRVHSGTLRAVASRWIEGRTLGWFSYEGRDKRDENDRIPHEDRRDLRGFGIWASWVDDVDTLDNNTLDSYLGAPGRGHVVHFQQGVGASFGRFYAKPIPYWMGRETYFSTDRVLASTMTLGVWARPWQDARLERERDEHALEWRQIGFFESKHFDPRHWSPIVDNPAFVRQTRRDRYWGAKQVAMFSAEEIRAAIRAGRFEPLAAERLFQVLWERRDKIARTYFAESAPLDHFHFLGDGLCFEDLWVKAGLGGLASYRASEGRRALLIAGGCIALPASEGYRVIELRVRREGRERRVRVHLIERSGQRRIIGVER